MTTALTYKTGAFPTTRMRRLRHHPQLRKMIQQTQLSRNDFVLPLFITHGHNVKDPIANMPGHYRWSIDRLNECLSEVVALKIPAVILFGIPEYKDENGISAYDDEGVIQNAVREIKRQAPELLVIADVCFCEYTSHGHCGVLTEQHAVVDVDNDKTLALLAKQSVSLANAGADMLAPSGMMDGMVFAMRYTLDHANYQTLPILSYAAKYCSAMYGPFRDAGGCSLQFGDRSTYQMAITNSDEALREIQLDLQEGADIIMVKPAHTYLDVICRIKAAYPGVPIAAYHVSGEYGMLKAAAAQGLLEESAAVLEVLTAIKRAGADFIVTYYAKEAINWLLESTV